MQSVLRDSSSISPFHNPTTNDSDIDFADVFGGPPRRRSLFHDVMRHSFSETAVSSSVVTAVGGICDTDEKPVFGDKPANRRRFTTGYFFNDIFRSNESSKGSPRKRSELDPFGSNPGTRVMSPARPLPTKAEPNEISLPAEFSLPAKLNKATEIPTFGSPTRSLSKNKDSASSSLLSRTSNQSNLRNGSSLKPDSDNVSEVVGRSKHFHFSIYKWPNNGVPTVLWGGSRWNVIAKAADEKLQQPSTLMDSSSTWGENVGKDQEKMGSQAYNVQTEPKSFSKPLSPDVIWRASGITSEARKANVKPIHSVLADAEDRRADEEVRRNKSRGKNTRHSSGDSRSKKKLQGRRSSLDCTKAEISNSLSSSSKAREVSGDGVKGKMKEFIKVFNQGGSIGTGSESLGQRFRWRTKEITIPNDDSVNETAEISSDKRKPTSDSPAVVYEIQSGNTLLYLRVCNSLLVMFLQGPDPPQMLPKQDSNTETRTPGISGQEQKQEPSAVHNAREDADEPFDLIFQVEEITQDEKISEQTGFDSKEIQNIDAKIQKWSQGRDTNIRSLLSTLQFILWPESGWKPVPLMDIIEANAVRKSYQKALLILHPDKLQQKGASSNQKYIAEKVFELLQGAWDFFNSVGPI